MIQAISRLLQGLHFSILRCSKGFIYEAYVLDVVLVAWSLELGWGLLSRVVCRLVCYIIFGLRLISLFCALPGKHRHFFLVVLLPLVLCMLSSCLLAFHN